MTKIKRLVSVLVAASLAAFYAVNADAASKSYSADIESISDKATTRAKMYFKDGKQRMESGKDSVTIMRPDKKVIWMLMPAENMYMEMPFTGKATENMPPTNNPDAKVEKTFMANETIDGHPAKKYHIKVTHAGKKEDSGYVWEAADLDNFPIKYQTEDKRATSTFKNIKSGGVSDSLFELPSGFRKMDMPGMGGSKMP